MWCVKKMDRFKNKILVKMNLLLVASSLVLVVISLFLGLRLFLADIFFMVGLALLCLVVADILLHASLMAGWFQRRHKGETDEEYQKRKIDVHQVGDKKNQPIHFDKLSVNSLIISVWLIVCSVVLTL